MLGIYIKRYNETAPISIENLLKNSTLNALFRTNQYFVLQKVLTEPSFTAFAERSKSHL